MDFLNTYNNPETPRETFSKISFTQSYGISPKPFKYTDWVNFCLRIGRAGRPLNVKDKGSYGTLNFNKGFVIKSTSTLISVTLLLNLFLNI